MLASIRFSPILRPCVVAAMGVAYVAVVAGIPLPAGKTRQKTGGLFPCVTCSCGCDSAEHCWRNCCCHSLTERLAWAAKNGVRPPEFALAEARAIGLDTAVWDGAPKVVNVSVAAAAAKPRCCAKKAAVPTPSCCSSKSASGRTCCTSKGMPSSHSDDEDRDVVGWRALACHGQSLNWLAAVPTLITVELEIADQLPLFAWLGPPDSASAAGIADAPTPPPPERA